MEGTALKKPKEPTFFQIQKAKKARAKFMGRSNAAYKLIKERSQPQFSLASFRAQINNAIGCACRYCGTTIVAKNFSPDHKHPLGRGGKASLGNIRIICLQCNQAKGMLTEKEFDALYRLIETWEDVAQRDLITRLRHGTMAKAKWIRRWKR